MKQAEPKPLPIEEAREQGANFKPKSAVTARLPKEPIKETIPSSLAEEMGLRSW